MAAKIDVGCNGPKDIKPLSAPQHECSLEDIAAKAQACKAAEMVRSDALRMKYAAMVPCSHQAVLVNAEPPSMPLHKPLTDKDGSPQAGESIERGVAAVEQDGKALDADPVGVSGADPCLLGMRLKPEAVAELRRMATVIAESYAEIDRVRLKSIAQTAVLKTCSESIANITNGVLDPLRDVKPSPPVLSPGTSAHGLNEDVANHVSLLTKQNNKAKKKIMKQARRISMLVEKNKKLESELIALRANGRSSPRAASQCAGTKGSMSMGAHTPPPPPPLRKDSGNKGTWTTSGWKNWEKKEHKRHIKNAHSNR